MNRLLYTKSLDNADNAKVIYESANGIPYGWFLLFGGRNFWEPDQKITERGGTSATRNKWVTPQGVAEARLGSAIDALSESPHLWPWFTPLPSMHRKALTLGKNGYFQLDAGQTTGSHRAIVEQAPAIMENVVNSLITEKYYDIRKQFTTLDPIVEFIPHFEKSDVKRFLDHVEASGKDASRLAGEFCCGTPPENADRYFSILEKDCSAAFDHINEMPPWPSARAPKPVAAAEASKQSAKETAKDKPLDTSKPSESKPKSFFQKLLGFFKRD